MNRVGWRPRAVRAFAIWSTVTAASTTRALRCSGTIAICMSAFWIEEPFVTATLTERDAPIYQNNDVEVFIAGQDAYYEFEINALGTIYEVLLYGKRPTNETDTTSYLAFNPTPRGHSPLTALDSATTHAACVEVFFAGVTRPPVGRPRRWHAQR